MDDCGLFSLDEVQLTCVSAENGMGLQQHSHDCAKSYVVGAMEFVRNVATLNSIVGRPMCVSRRGAGLRVIDSSVRSNGCCGRSYFGEGRTSLW